MAGEVAIPSNGSAFAVEHLASWERDPKQLAQMTKDAVDEDVIWRK